MLSSNSITCAVSGGSRVRSAPSPSVSHIHNSIRRSVPSPPARASLPLTRQSMVRIRQWQLREPGFEDDHHHQHQHQQADSVEQPVPRSRTEPIESSNRTHRSVPGLRLLRRLSQPIREQNRPENGDHPHQEQEEDFREVSIESMDVTDVSQLSVNNGDVELSFGSIGDNISIHPHSPPSPHRAEQPPEPPKVKSMPSNKIRERLTRGILAVQGAGVKTVNGVYRCTGMFDSVGMYTKEGLWHGERVTFTIFRCQHSDSNRRWYVSIVSKDHPPGTVHDTDLYTALAAVNMQANECGFLVDETPPEEGWRVVVGSGLEGPAPMCLWIPDSERVRKKKAGERHLTTRHRLMLCVVCMERPVTHIFVPCGHASVCRHCSRAWSSDAHNKTRYGERRCCPIARCKVESVIRIYGTVVEDVPMEEEKEDVNESLEFIDHFSLD